MRVVLGQDIQPHMLLRDPLDRRGERGKPFDVPGVEKIAVARALGWEPARHGETD